MEQLPTCVQNSLAHDFSHWLAGAEVEFIAPTADGAARQMRMRWSGGWHATGVVDPWAMAVGLRDIRLLRIRVGRYTRRVGSLRGV
ncbi:UNVERIFIED_CONTAM: hypothetical protein Slati_1102200 [Sesamum latifolium]|uniref:Uncharacterized protein n=1 Tax=Sesamum latifolium TaxID=2727402 RepID=A0AAW2XGD2_9LAMI